MSGRTSFAGALLSIGGIWGIVSIPVAESLTPGYNVSTEAVSGLGLPYFSGICNSISACLNPVQPASAIFVFSLLLSGIFTICSGYILRRAWTHRLFALGIVVYGIGITAVGMSYLPIYLGATSEGAVGVAYGIHITGALLAFVLGAAIAISTCGFTKGPFRYFGLVLGVLALIAFVLFLTGTDLGLGGGGMERLIIYPNNLWSICFGGYLLGGFELAS